MEAYRLAPVYEQMRPELDVTFGKSLPGLKQLALRKQMAPIARIPTRVATSASQE